jgi:hypothetical protein
MNANAPLSGTLPGTWTLVSRVIRSASGDSVPSALGDDPIALLIYDEAGNFAAQFMRRDRSGVDSPEATAATPSGANNSRAIGGYDAYFGRYTIDDAAGTVTQTLVGSLSPDNVGQVLTREMRVDGDRLTIDVATTTPAGEPATITLVWSRATA